jgi:hypothetical protein
LLVAVAVAGGCGGGPPDGSLRDGVGTTFTANVTVAAVAPATPSACTAPAEGCPCNIEGSVVSCPGPTVRTGNYTTCAPGQRACTGGRWEACVAKTLYESAPTLIRD